MTSLHILRPYAINVLDLLGYDSSSSDISEANGSSDVEEVDTDSDVADDVNIASLPDQEQSSGEL